MQVFKYILIIIGIVLVFSGCASKKMIRTDSDICKLKSMNDTEKKCTTSSIEHYDKKDMDFTLSYVEYDDQGLLYSREQLDKTLGHIKNIKTKQDIVVFIHGWRHNAKTDDENVVDIRGYLKAISSLANSKKNGRKISGVYVGWRGVNIDIFGEHPFLLDAFTFYNRKDVSIEIGNGQIIELLLELEKMKNENPNSRLFIIGHSFGGSIVLTALKNIFANRALTSKSGAYKGFGNSVILINPAIEGTSYFELREISEYLNANPENIQKDKRPNLITVTSNGDMATKLAFPIARFLPISLLETHSTINRKNQGYYHNQYSEFDMDLYTVGHFEKFTTHYLDADRGSMKNDNCEPSKSKNWRTQMYKQFNDNNKSYNFQSSKLGLTYLNNSNIYDPYWVIETNDDVIKGHNGIFSQNFGCFISELYYQEE